MGEIINYFNKYRFQEVLENKLFNPRDLKVITISRTTGCGARIIAKKLAEDLGYSIWDKELLLAMADDSKIKRNLLDKLDEKYLNELSSIGSNFIGDYSLNNYVYKKELAKLLFAICKQNKAIIIGRGANYLIKNALHIKLDASLDKRITKIAKELNVSDEEAKKEIIKSDKDRHNFTVEAFGKEVVSHFQYDLTISTNRFTVDDTCEIIKTALHQHIKNLQNKYID